MRSGNIVANGIGGAARALSLRRLVPYAEAVRSRDIRTKRAALAAYLAAGSARVLLVAAVILIAARVLTGGWGRGDLLALVVTVAITGTVEWIIHKYLLHADEAAWVSRRLGVGTGHRRHHMDPTDMEWLMLTGVDAGVFVTAFGFVTVAWSVPLLWITGSALLGPFLTAWTLAALGLAHYEWVHLLVHTRYRPTTRYYARLAKNHRLHHYRNENYWFGVTSNSGDRLLRTYPRDMSDVPLSDTARTLA